MFARADDSATAFRANDAKQRRVAQVIALAVRAGLVAAGWTDARVLGTDKAGQPIVSPPRARFADPHGLIRMTVGPMRTQFYFVEDGAAVMMAAFDTWRVDEIAAYLAGIVWNG